MALSTRSSTFWKCRFMLLQFSLISNVETVYLKRYLILQQGFYHLAVFSTSFMSLPELPLFDCFPKQLTIIDKKRI